MVIVSHTSRVYLYIRRWWTHDHKIKCLERKRIKFVEDHDFVTRVDGDVLIIKRVKA